MRKIVDYTIYDQVVNKDNITIAKDFLIEKKSQGKSSGTVKGYRNDLQIISFLLYQHFDNKCYIALNRKDVRNLSIVFQGMEMSNARINRLMCTLRSMLEYCADDDDYEYEFNVGSRVKGLPKRPIREITFLTEEQVEWLIDEMLKKNNYLIAMYLALSYYSAKRKSEVHQVLKDGLTERYYTNKVTGKGGKSFRIFYNDRVRDIIRLYLDDRGHDDIPYLFVKVYSDKTKQVVTKHAFDYWCKKASVLLSEREKRNIHINPHAFRHSRLDNLKQAGIPLEKLKVLANHNDISTTESYLADRSEEDIADIFGMNIDCFKK